MDALLAKLKPIDVVCNIGRLYDAGASIANLDELVAQVEPIYVANHIEYLLKAGANIDVDGLVDNLEADDFYFIDDLLEAGADANKLMAKLSDREIHCCLDDLLEAGADANKLVARLDPVDIAYNITKLCKAGADVDVNALLTKLEPVDIAFNLTALNEAGANINGDKLFASLEPQDIKQRLRDCKRPDTGADADRLVARMDDCEGVFGHLDKLLEAGVDPVGLLARLDLYAVECYFKIFLEAGAPNEVMARLEEAGAHRGIDNVVRNNIKDFLDAGADIHQVARWLIAESRGVNVRHVS